ncbi:MAG: DNA adenine methylase [Candidatus Methylumidiphilus sp.]
MSTPNKIISPLRYPGSKATFLKVVLEFIEVHGLKGREIVEPYAGSGIVSLSLVANNLVSHATLVERDPLLYSFWKAVFEHTDILLSSIEDININMDTWYELRVLLKHKIPENELIPDLALACLFFNRTNFSGVLHSGPIGGKDQSSDYKLDCRFNKKDIISRIRQISSLRDGVSVKFGDALEFLQKANIQNHEKRFFYVDPPYFKQGRKLYRYYYKVIDHKRLYDILSVATFPWLLSYDKHEFIELLYDGFPQVHQSFRYMSRTPKNENELVVTNMVIPVLDTQYKPSSTSVSSLCDRSVIQI